MAEPLEAKKLFSTTTFPGVEISSPRARLLRKRQLRISTSGVQVRFSSAMPAWIVREKGFSVSRMNSRSLSLVNDLAAFSSSVHMVLLSMNPTLSPGTAHRRPTLMDSMNRHFTSVGESTSIMRTQVPWMLMGSSIRYCHSQSFTRMRPLQPMA